MPAKKDSAKNTSKKSVKSGALLRPKVRFDKSTAIVLVAIFAIIGAYFVFFGGAATPPPSPPPGGYFATSTPGSALPSEADCNAKVTKTGWEPRPQNTKANQTVPSGVSIPGYTPEKGYDSRARALADRVTGNFKGTTDEIVQWASCKWGFSDDTVRAVMVSESIWHQGELYANGQPVNDKGYGDFTTNPAGCATGYTVPCPQSFGITQVKWTAHAGTFPNSRDATAFNIDYALMYRRICYEGYSWLRDYHTTYKAGDEWGCIGHWYSGAWGSPSDSYIATTKGHYDNKPWRSWAHIYPQPPQGTVSLAFTPTTVKPGQTMTVNWSVPTGHANTKDWIAIFKQGATNADYGEWHYTGGATSGTMTFAAPVTAGTYEFRYLLNDSFTSAATSKPITVGTTSTTPSPSPPPSDTGAPSVTITSPTNGAYIGNSVSINGTTSDNTGVTKREVWIDGKLRSSGLPYTWGTKRGVARGAHTITVKAYDAAGNVGQASVTVYK